MIQLGNYTIAFESDILLIIIGCLALAIYSFFIYKYTIPQISTFKKGFLIIIRTIALVLILFLIFEPLFTVDNTDAIKPVNLVMIDNSKSIVLQDSTSRVNSINNVIDGLDAGDKENYKFYSFGDGIKETRIDSVEQLHYNASRTNFEKIFSYAKENSENLSSITIITDGIVNDGYNPIYEAEQFGVPIFTVGVGDTTKQKDVFIKNIFYNKLIYQNAPTQIAVDIANENFEDKEIKLNLTENDRTISSQTIKLSETSINRVYFDYTAESPGEMKMAFSIPGLANEENTRNNYKPFYINVLKNKLKIVIIAGSPSSDLRIMKSTLENNEEFDVTSIVQINSDDILNYKKTTLDSAEVLFLMDYPKANISSELKRQIDNLITGKNLPFFFTIGSNNPQTLAEFIGSLPFTISLIQKDYFSAQPVATSNLSAILSDNPTEWNNMPPVLYNGSRFKAKTGAVVLLNARIRNIDTNMPLIIANARGRQRSISVLASELWKWKLQSSNKTLFDNFLFSSIKWLNADRTKSNFAIETDRKFYSAGEEVVFSAQLYDESLQPKDDAEVIISLNNGQELILDSIGNGIYTGSVPVNKTGEYTYTANASDDNIILETKKGRFSVGDLNLESQNTKLDDEYLKLMSKLTGGNYYPIDRSDELHNKLEQINRSQTIVKTERKGYKLWSSEIFLVILIALFALEWLIRKKEGML